MRLQLALDLVTLDGARRLLDTLGDAVDIVEVGTPWIMQEGMRPVTALKQAYPHLQVLADLKIMDAGEHEARIGFDAGADIVTVLGAAGDRTVGGVVAAARRAKGEVMADLIAVPDVRRRAAEIDALGVDYVCVHTAFDEQQTGKDPLAELRLAREGCSRARAAVAGGVKLATLPAIAELQPAIVVVGGAITGAPDPAAVAREMQRLMR
jgi:3-hexulose-6-phosphate synthase